MEILGRFSPQHAAYIEAVADEVFEYSHIRTCCDVQYHPIFNKISVMVYPRLVKYLTRTEYIPFKYKDIDIRLIQVDLNEPLNNLFNSITKY